MTRRLDRQGATAMAGDSLTLEIECPDCRRRQQIIGRSPEVDWAVYCPTCRYFLGTWSELTEEPDAG
jgi:ribosomal protein S27E